VEDHLQQHVTELLQQVDVVPGLDGVDELVGLLDEVAQQRGVVLLEVPGAAVVGVAQAPHHLDEPQDLRAGGLLGEEDQLDLQVVLGGHARERRREAVVLRTEQVDDPALPAGALDQRLGDPRSVGRPGTGQVEVARSSAAGSTVSRSSPARWRWGARGALGVADQDPSAVPSASQAWKGSRPGNSSEVSTRATLGDGRSRDRWS
jgi:hypothetical protein